MKKKLFAAIAAGTMLCGMLTAPVSAAETNYQMGDVNMDGAVAIAWARGRIDTPISVVDAQILLIYYTRHMSRPDLTLEDVLTEKY